VSGFGYDLTQVKHVFGVIGVCMFAVGDCGTIVFVNQICNISNINNYKVTTLMSSPPIIFVDDYDFNIANDNNDTINSTNPLLPSTFNSNVRLSSSYRWLILLGFSLLTFASACLWITFAPCLYIFMSYFSQSPSSINSLSSVYMIMYPILLIPSINFFNTYGIKFSVIFGAFLNSLGQAIASIAQLFMLSVPPKLANIWFSQFGEQNFATSVGITANSAGVAAGRTRPLSTNDTNISYYLSDKLFMILTISYGIVTGGEYALSTLLSQMILPVFEKFDESTVGFLGFLIVIAGMIGSLVIGIYLDRTLAYESTCRWLYVGAIISLGLFNIALKYEMAELVFFS
ncbi:11701_t:CDS:2, partial [Dentiscutata heterogama]